MLDFVSVRPFPLEFRGIASRYKRLILFAEEADRIFYRGIWTDRAKRVMEDAEK